MGKKGKGCFQCPWNCTKPTEALPLLQPKACLFDHWPWQPVWWVHHILQAIGMGKASFPSFLSRKTPPSCLTSRRQSAAARTLIPSTPVSMSAPMSARMTLQVPGCGGDGWLVGRSVSKARLSGYRWSLGAQWGCCLPLLARQRFLLSHNGQREHWGPGGKPL